MAKKFSTAVKVGITNATDALKKVKAADETLTEVLKYLVGMCMSVEDKDEVYFTDVFYDPNPNSTDEDKIRKIAYDEDEELVAFVRGDDDYESNLDDLPLGARIELTEALIKKLK
jgi:hypothetical protein